MIRIAILDDTEPDRSLMERLTKEYFERTKLDCEIAVFSESDTMLEGVRGQKYYDIFLLDMEMPDRTGLQVAQEIRKSYPEPFIVYVTNYVEYAIAAFEVNAFRYIPKALLKEKLPQAFDALIPRIEGMDSRVYLTESAGEMGQILQRNIFYIKKDGKYSVIYHRNGSCRERKTLQDILRELDSDAFLYVDKSYIVNVLHVCSCKKGIVYLRDGTALPVSRPRYNAVKETLSEYWRTHR